MSSVTGRIKEIKQPRGGYIKPSQFEMIIRNDDLTLSEEENIHFSLIGMTVDYLTRFINGANKEDAFKISLIGALTAEKLGVINSYNIALELLDKVNGLDDTSVINACKLVTFDVWHRNPQCAFTSKNYSEINPDEKTVHNIRVLVKRSADFWVEYGPIKCDGFTFEPQTKYNSEITNLANGNYGGYTATVNSGDGDYLTEDTLWDFKVTKNKISSKNTLQLLMYWIMGNHSGQEIYKSITKLGIYNPRLNVVYLLNVKDIPKEIVQTVEREVICYD